MQLSKKSEYALLAVRHLATVPDGEFASINEIASSEPVPREFLAKILKELASRKLLVSRQGVAGGYRLATTPNKVSYLDVIEAVDGPLSVSSLSDGSSGSRRHASYQGFKSFWKAQNDRLRTALKRQHFGSFKRVGK